MTRILSFLKISFFIFLGCIVIGGMMWGNTLYAREHHKAKDFLVPWLAAQTFLQYGDPTSPDRVTPYSNPTAQRAQIIYYGRLAGEDEDPLILWLPFPLELIYFPFALVNNFEIASGLWMTICEISLIVSGFLAIRLFRWKSSRLSYFLVLLFPAIWVYGLLNIISGSALPLILLASMGVLSLLESHQDDIAGALLIFPLMYFGIFSVLVFFTIWWAINNRRWRLVAGLGMGLSVMFLIAFILLPDWVMPFLRGLYQHYHFNPSFSTYQFLGDLFPLAGPRIAIILTGIVVTLILVEWRSIQKARSQQVIWIACQAIAVAPLTGLPVEAVDYAALIIPLLLILAILDERFKTNKIRFLSGITVSILLIVTYFLTFSLGFQLYLPISILTLLYWMRWWAIRPSRLQSINNNEIP